MTTHIIILPKFGVFFYAVKVESASFTGDVSKRNKRPTVLVLTRPILSPKTTKSHANSDIVPRGLTARPDQT